ncbi:MAG: hypothetical protein HY815_09990 [Candidatus Riflebacteria bacterium]|nr:hypothetical protein [Candidatus Riflebacteria bacterium]
MGYVRRDTRHGEGLMAEGVKALEEPMEATLADHGGLARMTWQISGSREAGATWLVATVEFVGFGVQVFLEDPLLRFDQVRTFAEDLWHVADRQEGELEATFEPYLKIKARSPSRLTSRLEVTLDFTMGTDAHVTANLQADGTLTLAFVDALDRALEAVEEL